MTGNGGRKNQRLVSAYLFGSLALLAAIRSLNNTCAWRNLVYALALGAKFWRFDSSRTHTEMVAKLGQTRRIVAPVFVGSNPTHPPKNKLWEEKAMSNVEKLQEAQDLINEIWDSISQLLPDDELDKLNTSLENIIEVKDDLNKFYTTM